MEKTQLQEMAKKAAAVEIYYFISEKNHYIHSNNIKDVAPEFDDINALPEEVDCEAELMDPETYDETILANTCVCTDDFWDNPDDRILVVVLTRSQYQEITRQGEGEE